VCVLEGNKLNIIKKQKKLICFKPVEFDRFRKELLWRRIIHAKEIDIGIYTNDFENEFISLTYIAKYRSDEPRDVIKNLMAVMSFTLEKRIAHGRHPCYSG
jgi:AAA15 family ATPase/GTPase